MTIGQRIAQKRKELGLSQEALGSKLGVSRQSIYKWEADSALPEVDKLIALSRLFGVSVGWLLGGSMSWLSRTVFIIVGLSSLCLIPGLFMAETKTAE